MAAFAVTGLCLATGAAGAQSELSVSPFMAVLPAGGASPLAGLALTLGGAQSGFALRASGNLALQNSNTTLFNTGGTYRPWGVDADAMLFLGGRGYRQPSLAPFLFAGLGTESTDSLGYNARQSNWSYGAGLQVPLGSAIAIFGESRWRMSRFMLPTASDAPSPTTEFRFGMTFRVGSGGDDGGSRSHGWR
ncbi:MAG: hypothetical protein ACHQWU_01425 [Gemmatimonadales bacterium]